MTRRRGKRRGDGLEEGSYIPDEHEIWAQCEEIRKTWTPKQKAARIIQKTPQVEVYDAFDPIRRKGYETTI